MGKKRARGPTGLSSHILDAFKQASASDRDSSTTVPASTVSINLNEEEIQDRPSKKRKLDLIGRGNKKYDATGLVPFYTHIDQVPWDLRKYFSQRHRFFSLYSSGALLDKEGWYSVTPELIAAQIADRCRCDTVLDAFCGVGGNAIQFAMTCESVIALDTSPLRLRLAQHNAALYGVAHRIEFIQADYLDFARAYLSIPSQAQTNENTKRKIDVVFLSPPWGGPGYIDGPIPASPTKNTASTSSHPLPTPLPSPVLTTDEEQHPEYSLDSIQPIPGKELWKLTRKITRNVAFYLPRNVKLEEVGKLVSVNQDNQDAVQGESDGVEGAEGNGNSPELVEVEEEWMGSKLKAVCCYFGGLVSGQEELF